MKPPGLPAPLQRVDDALNSGALRLQGLFRSPIRGPWLTSVFGMVLLVGIPVEFVTGLVSYAAYNPRLAGNDQTPTHGLLGFYLFQWTTSPDWLYRVTQGTHVLLGLALIPVVAAKLWSVIPKLFAWPPVRSVAVALERLSLALIVGGIIFEMSTGVLNIDYDYVFRFSFYKGHFFGAWVFIAGFVAHVAIKLPTMVRSLRSRRLRTEMRTGLAGTRPEEVDSELVATHPGRPTISRRGALALVGGSSLSIFALTAGESIGPLRREALLAPRGGVQGPGPDDFQVNRTAALARVTPALAGPSWRLHLIGERTVVLSRDELLAMELQTRALPIACVEGWSTLQRWTGVPLAHLAALAGTARPSTALVSSLETGGAFGRVTLAGNQVTARESLLALSVNGAPLSLDHGYPARTIIPAAPGVHNTKWVTRIELFR